METSRTIDVRSLDATQRRALEDVIGVQLQANQRLIIGVTEVDLSESPPTARPAQSLDDWTKVYDGLSSDQIQEIDRVAKIRANLTRHTP
jgi:hypothetical protein